MKMGRSIFPWAAGFAVLVLLSLDFWNWGRALPLVLGMPYWVVAFFLLNLTLCAYYVLFSVSYWRD